MPNCKRSIKVSRSFNLGKWAPLPCHAVDFLLRYNDIWKNLVILPSIRSPLVFVSSLLYPNCRSRVTLGGNLFLSGSLGFLVKFLKEMALVRCIAFTGPPFLLNLWDPGKNGDYEASNFSPQVPRSAQHRRARTLTLSRTPAFLTHSTHSI